MGIKDPSITHSAHKTKPSRLTTNPVVGLLILDMPQLSSARSLHNQLISIKFVANCLFHACLYLAPHSRHNQSRHQEHKPCRTTSVHVRDAGGTPPSVSIMRNHARALPRAREQVGKLPTDRSQQTVDRRARQTHTEPATFTQNHRFCLCGHCLLRSSFCTLSISTPRTTASPTARSKPTHPPKLAHWRCPDMMIKDR